MEEMTTLKSLDEKGQREREGSVAGNKKGIEKVSRGWLMSSRVDESMYEHLPYEAVPQHQRSIVVG